jgi:hypothetical protein
MLKAQRAKRRDHAEMLIFNYFQFRFSSRIIVKMPIKDMDFHPCG